MKNFFLRFAVIKIFIFALVFTPFFSSAASVGAYSPKVGNTVAGVIQQKTVARGFAANDPKYGATVAAIGTALTIVASAAVGGATAPFWLTLLVGSAVTFAVSLAADSLYKWAFNSDGSISVTGSQPTDGYSDPIGTYTPQATVIGGPYLSIGGSSCASGSPVTVALCVYGDPANNGGKTNVHVNSCVQQGPGFLCNVGWTDINGEPRSESMSIFGYSSGSTSACATNAYYKNGGCVIASGSPSPNAGQSQDKPNASPAQALASVPAADLSKPANPALMADTINKAWQKAAMDPMYQGVPYSYSDPVTAADVAAWQASNPASYPTVQDLLSKAVNPATGSVPVTAPGTGAVTPPVTNPGTNPTTINVTVDLGPNPGVPTPGLEATPTGSQILAPLLNIMPGLKAFQVPNHSAECPKPQFDLPVINTHVVMDAQCKLFEDVRPQLFSGAFLAWVIAALFIVLSA